MSSLLGKNRDQTRNLIKKLNIILIKLGERLNLSYFNENLQVNDRANAPILGYCDKTMRSDRMRWYGETVRVIQDYLF